MIFIVWEKSYFLIWKHWFIHIFKNTGSLKENIDFDSFLFKVERGSPKSCFLFLGSVLCEVNWVSVLSDAWSPSPRPETRGMIVCLLFMMILLAKEDQLVDQAVSLESLWWRLGKAS